MRQWKRTVGLILTAVLSLSLLSGCGEQDEAWAMTVCLGSEVGNLDPIRAKSAEARTVIGHLYENLMRISADASGRETVASGAARKYSMEENYDGTVTYTFHLREEKWSDGIALQAQDFVYAWRRLADPVSASPHARLLSIVAGYDEVRATGDVSRLQVEAKNSSTLLVTLKGHCSWFLQDVCTDPATVPLREDVVQSLKQAAIEANIAAEQQGMTGTATWSSDPMKLVTNGRYTVTATEDTELLLNHSETYGGTADGPEELRFLLCGSAEEAWETYRSGNADATTLMPETESAELAEKDWSLAADLNTGALLFNTRKDLFSEVGVRQAFSLCMDRQAICDAVGSTVRPAEGLVPYGMPDEEGEDFRTRGGDLLSLSEEDGETAADTARALLEESGYLPDRYFPAVECLYEKSEKGDAIAAVLREVWQETLRIRVTMTGVSGEELETALHGGEYDMAITEISAYARDAESFLARWSSSAADNVIGYSNGAYDTLMRIIDRASDQKARLGCLHDAESLLLGEYPLTPLYFSASGWEGREDITGMIRDGRDFFCFSSAAERKD